MKESTLLRHNGSVHKIYRATLPHSPAIYGSRVETRRPYSCYYMRLYISISIVILTIFIEMVNKNRTLNRNQSITFVFIFTNINT